MTTPPRSRRSNLIKGVATMFLCSGLALAANIPAAAQIGSPHATRPEATPQDLCLDSNKGNTIYGPVKAAYVGGTVVGMPLKRKGDFPFYFIATRQLRVEGKLALGKNAAQFCFEKRGKATIPPGHSYTITCTDSKKPDQCWIQFPYAKINGLSRATKPSGDQATNRTAYIGAAGAVLTAVLSASSKAHVKELFGGIALGAGVVGYYYMVARPERMENYVAVFVCPGGTQSLPCPETGTSATPSFPRGGLFMFRVPNRHDYYNISMILSAETGRTFVPETTEKGVALSGTR